MGSGPGSGSGIGISDVPIRDKSKVAVVAVGVVSLHLLGDKVLVLEDCLYVPNVRKNLISVSCLACNVFSAIFNKNFISINMMLMRSIVEC